MDIELAVDAMEMAEHLDHIVLFSGDGDFRSLVEAVQRKGVRVSVVSTNTTQPAMVADEFFAARPMSSSTSSIFPRRSDAIRTSSRSAHRNSIRKTGRAPPSPPAMTKTCSRTERGATMPANPALSRLDLCAEFFVGPEFRF